ncbi:MAG TPA: response regulator transcription factor [Solirubrobacterales bacterium]|nr:response regulator transcription factor [Solirubrobacterales bacterium]
MAEPNRIRILLADDHVVVRHGLKRILAGEFGFEVVAEAGRGDEVIAATAELAPDVLVLDLNMPGRPTPEVVLELREGGSEAGILILTMEADPVAAHEVIEAGADVYLLKQAADDELVEAIRAAAARERRLPREIERGIAALAGDGSREKGALSGREMEVLRLAALGHTNPKIAEALGISIRTVETHRTRVMQKASISTRPELVRYALERGLLES